MVALATLLFARFFCAALVKPVLYGYMEADIDTSLSPPDVLTRLFGPDADANTLRLAPLLYHLIMHPQQLRSVSLSLVCMVVSLSFFSISYVLVVSCFCEWSLPSVRFFVFLYIILLMVVDRDES